MQQNDLDYTVQYVSGVMSLRKPQKRSLEILSDILLRFDELEDKTLYSFENLVKDRYQIFREFEHPYPALTFALSMGVGKTKLMGAFITYLYANRNIKNFFIVAPGLTIYEKLQNDLGNPTSSKYVFKGVGCFSFPPNIITGENYSAKTAVSLSLGDVNIFIFNNAKFNRETANIKNFSEILGQSYFEYLSNIDDLVVILDESHHYRDNATGFSIDELNPYLAIELTGTPHIITNGTNVNFNNVVYDYPMAKAIEDGYTKTPYAMTRRDLILGNFSQDQIDIIMIKDGIDHHENIKQHLLTYSRNFNERIVKPFLLIVCRNTAHADKIEGIIKSDDFYSGTYKDKVIKVHSNQGNQEKDENIKLLLSVEKTDNPIEIVVHVDILKEGWDVNNLFTIVPLRPADSRVLRMQTIGRGLRLPYGYRTDDKLVDSLTITAHDRFEEIVQEAQDPNGIFRKQNIIYKEDIEVARSFQTQTIFDLIDNQSSVDFLSEIGVDRDKSLNRILKVQELIKQQIFEKISCSSTVNKPDIYQSAISEMHEDADLYEKVKKHNDIFERWIDKEIIEIENRFKTGYMFIPEIMINSDGETSSYFVDFDLDISKFSFEIVDNELLIKNLIDLGEVEIVKTRGVDFLVDNPYKLILQEILSVPEINYDENSHLINKVIKQLLDYLVAEYGEDQLNHILVYNKRRIAKLIVDQFMENLITIQPELIETVIGVDTNILSPRYNVQELTPLNIYTSDIVENIKKYVYSGFKKSLHLHYKFDSNPERVFAIICDSDPSVIRWIRPAPMQFKLFYSHGKRYQPDFVVETENCMYLVEIKGEDRINDADVLLKKTRAISYCKLATTYSLANGYKPWKHMFIPASEFSVTSSFGWFVSQYIITE